MDSAALIIGGVRTLAIDGGVGTVLSSVEVFGCPRSISIPLDDGFPVGIYATGGVHYVQVGLAIQSAQLKGTDKYAVSPGSGR